MNGSGNKILVLDDDTEICRLLVEFLGGHQFSVHTANTVADAHGLLDEHEFQLAILDLMLPDDSGTSFCRSIRERKLQMPVIMLTAVNDNTDIVLNLEMGADVYLTKPFNLRVLLAHVTALLRRANEPVAEVNELDALLFEGYRLDLNTRQLFDKENKEIVLTSGEYDLLYTLLKSPGRVLSRDYLMDATRDRDLTPTDRTIDIQVSRLRQKLEDNPKEPKLIKTVRNGGYLFTAKVVKQ